MTGAVLGIDTSCYTTSCALASPDGLIISDIRKLLDVPMGECGLRQSEAVFSHLRSLPEVLHKAMEDGGNPDIVAVCASKSPLDGPDSYMPVFQAGASFARAISASLKAPCFLTSHQRGHFAAARIGVSCLTGKYLAVHLSGGTTEIVLCEGESLQTVAGSGDISAGQLLDRVGVLLGFSFPSGPQMEKLAMMGESSGRYASSVKNGILHLSGAEAAAFRDVRQKSITDADIAANVFDVIARSLIKAIAYASKQTGVCNVLVTGGVAASSLLREQLLLRAEKTDCRLCLRFGMQKYSGDSAAGVALIGAMKYRSMKEDENGYDTQRERAVPES